MIYAGILAGGIGRRMQRADLPKQYLMLGKKPIFIHTLEQFLIHPEVNRILIAVPQEWIAYTKDCLRKYLPNLKEIYVIAGGADRNDSLMCILRFIQEQWELKEEDVIISHDAIRPFVSQRILSDNIRAAEHFDAIDTVIPAFDTIVESKDGKEISNIPDRSEMYQGQTPQTFRAMRLKELYESLDEKQKSILTDAAKIFVIKGLPVALVPGDSSNMKITTPYDLRVASALIESEDK